MVQRSGSPSDLGRAVSADLLVKMRSALPGLQPAEQRVALVALADPAATAQLSIGALAASAETSVTTVMRFSRAVGFANYPQLRLALAGAAAREEARGAERTPDNGDLNVGDSLAEVVEKIIYNEARALEDTAANLDVEVLERAVTAILAARRIDIFGVGASGFVAMDLHQKLHRIGLLAFIWTEAHAALTAAALLQPGDVAIGISYSGSTLDTVEALQLAGRGGARTIALTNFAGSALTQSAELTLTTAVRETPFRSGATASRIAQLAVIDCLFVGVAQRSYSLASVALNATRAAVKERRTPIARRAARE